MIDCAALCIGRCKLEPPHHQSQNKITFPMKRFCVGRQMNHQDGHLLSWRLDEWVKTAPFHIRIIVTMNSQNAEPGLLVANASGSRSHTLNGL